MTALVVVESCFGNTAEIARVIGERLGADVVAAADAPSELPGGVELLLLGAPTHAMGLPSAKTRDEAVKRGGNPPGSGVREWIDRVAPSPARVVTFDTAVPKGTLFGSAAKAAAKALRRRGFTRVEAGEHFWITGERLADGETARAADWAAQLLA